MNLFDNKDMDNNIVIESYWEQIFDKVKFCAKIICNFRV